MLKTIHCSTNVIKILYTFSYVSEKDTLMVK